MKGKATNTLDSHDNFHALSLSQAIRTLFPKGMVLVV